jgi:predicted nucleic acid-binding protein
VIVVDSSALLAGMDAADPYHDRVRSVTETDSGPFLLSPFVAAEVDYMLATRAGVSEELAFLRTVAEGALSLHSFDADDIAEMADLVDRYRDLRIGLADASLVVLADRAGTRRILTLDERHFRALRPLRGRSFKILPADA